MHFQSTRKRQVTEIIDISFATMTSEDNLSKARALLQKNGEPCDSDEVVWDAIFNALNEYGDLNNFLEKATKSEVAQSLDVLKNDSRLSTGSMKDLVLMLQRFPGIKDLEISIFAGDNLEDLPYTQRENLRRVLHDAVRTLNNSPLNPVHVHDVEELKKSINARLDRLDWADTVFRVVLCSRHTLYVSCTVEKDYLSMCSNILL